MRLRTYNKPAFSASILALSVMAWLALWLWGQSPYSRFLSHHSLDIVRGDVALMPVFVAGWTVMVITMMLPTSLPLIPLLHALTRQRLDHLQLTALLIAGYLAIWTLSGAVVFTSDWLLRQAWRCWGGTGPADPWRADRVHALNAT